jgi:hypothetical protein
VSWRGFGEIVTVRATSIGSQATDVEIDSDAVQVTLLWDWGANARNLRRIKDTLFGKP